MKTVSSGIVIFIASIFLAASPLMAQIDPKAETFMALEKQAHEASNKGDSKFFEGILSDKFIMRNGGQRMDKAATVKGIADINCDVKTLNLDEQWMTKIDADTYLISYRSRWDGTCIGSDGKSAEIKRQERVATVWIRNGDKWQVVFHGANPIVDPKNAPKTAPSVEPAAKAATSNTAVTKALATVERAVWEAWRAHDFKKLDALTAKSLAFIDIFGNSYDDRKKILKTWSSPVCKIKSVNVTDPVAYSLSPTVALLTHIGTARGTCYGEKIGEAPIYGNSIYVKEGRKWKLAFTMNMPAE